MNPHIPSRKDLNGDEGQNSPVAIHSISGLGLAGFFGSPVAVSYLIYRNLTALGRQDLLWVAAAWYGPFMLFWLYCLLSSPPDVISQLILYLPQTILWWIVARHLFVKLHAHCHVRGRLFFSRWRSIWAGLLTYLVIQVVFFLQAFLAGLLHI